MGSEPPDPIVELLTSYGELNSSFVTELHDVPSALEFMRYVSLNRPFVVRGGAEDWQAMTSWDLKTLKGLLEGRSVNVAVTPFGNADSPTRNKNDELVFVKPIEELQDFTACIDFISEQEKSGTTNGEVRYCQTQNDNLRNEYSALFSHVEKDISFARIALQRRPEAINMWIGNSHSVTALHKDNYENIYVQIRGQKHFVLLPPLYYPCVSEELLKPARYVRTKNGEMEIVLDLPEDGNEAENVPFATWDPDSGIEEGYAKHAKPLRVTLEEGDMLYLPALWYHKVSQTCSEEGICCAVNYWYDMDFGGGFYSLCNFVKSVATSDGSKDSSRMT